MSIWDFLMWSCLGVPLLLFVSVGIKKLLIGKKIVFEKGNAATCNLTPFKYEVHHIPQEGVGFCGYGSSYGSRYSCVYKRGNEVWLLATVGASKFGGVIVERTKEGLTLHVRSFFFEEKGIDPDGRMESVSKIIITSPLVLLFKAIKYKKHLKKSIQIAKDNLIIKDVIE